MVYAEDIRPGHLLISQAHELYCVVEIKLDLDYPDKSIITGEDLGSTFTTELVNKITAITGVNNKNIKLSGTPDQWFHLWDSSINIRNINI